ncbi:MAG: rRNA maturation RNase YbeY [Clostridia bacterium]|nr:rRNA maturation RNase YbeY [Clostridia bacterium]MBQ3042177.1 rRNA maturation RNase YbeY [Clostridia bacterium]MBQ4272301.1 rRNA maturation RNase YbeY [Clostridia bacterium]
MKIYFDNVGLFTKPFIKRVLERALKHLNQPSELLEMSLSIVSPEQIQELNKSFREVDKVTDVLSFPTCDNPTRGAITVVCEDVNPETDLVNIGDIVICLERAKEQAKEYGHSLKRELAFLSLHGLLHLLGYDHVEEEDEKQMIALQKEILDQAGITR